MNPVSYFEITFTDKERAKQFYGSTFGWHINDVPSTNYSMIMTADSDEQGQPRNSGQINGGLMEKDETAPYPIIVVEVKSIDQSLSVVERNGGQTLLPKVTLGEHGFYARIKDPEGNVLGLWQSAHAS